MVRLFFIALGGAGGALLRYAVTRGAAFTLGDAFPYGTLAANLLGCLAIGAVWTWTRQAAWPPEATGFVLVGLLGAFTTFSTYGLESVRLLQDGAVLRGGLYLAASNGLGLGFVAAGMAAARWALGSGA